MEVIAPMRMDRGRHRPVSPIGNAVFDLGVPVDATPVWIGEPDQQVQGTFWQHVAPSLSQEHVVKAAVGVQNADELRDLRNRPVSWDARGPGALFLIDRDPWANWAHDCTWVFVSADGIVSTHDHQWPPKVASRLLPLTRPAGG